MSSCILVVGKQSCAVIWDSNSTFSPTLKVLFTYYAAIVFFSVCRKEIKAQVLLPLQQVVLTDLSSPETTKPLSYHWQRDKCVMTDRRENTGTREVLVELTQLTMWSNKPKKISGRTKHYCFSLIMNAAWEFI